MSDASAAPGKTSEVADSARPGYTDARWGAQGARLYNTIIKREGAHGKSEQPSGSAPRDGAYGNGGRALASNGVYHSGHPALNQFVPQAARPKDFTCHARLS